MVCGQIGGERLRNKFRGINFAPNFGSKFRAANVIGVYYYSFLHKKGVRKHFYFQEYGRINHPHSAIGHSPIPAPTRLSAVKFTYYFPRIIELYECMCE